MQKKSNNRMLVIYVKRSYTEKENNISIFLPCNMDTEEM